MASRILSQPTMNVWAAAREYVQRMLGSPGLKVLILDADTSGMLSSVISHTQILSKEVVLLEKLHPASGRSEMKHLRAVFFVRPTPVNIEALVTELEHPKYASYEIYFSNAVARDELERLARADVREVVSSVREHFLDFYGCNPDTFTVEATPSAPLCSTARAADALLSVVLSQKRRPAVIRYQGSSERATALASRLQSMMRTDASLFEGIRKGATTAVLILDRADDAATPLLTQWTYQAMLHNAFGLLNGVVTTKPDAVAAAVGNPQAEVDGQFVLSLLADSFYQKNLYSQWGDFCRGVKEFLDEFKASGGGGVGGEKKEETSLEDLQRVIDQMPQIRRLGGEVNKHVALMSALNAYIKRGNLYKVSELEQEICANSAATEQLRTLSALVAEPATPPDVALRLCLLYSLRYEGREGSTTKLQAILQAKGVPASEIALLDVIVRYGGSARAGSSEGGIFGAAGASAVRSALGGALRGFKDVSCVFTQHKPALVKTLQRLIRGRLPAEQFPAADAPSMPASSWRPTEVIVYVVGGMTYEEALCVAAFNDPLCPATQTASEGGADLTGGADVKVLLGGDVALTPQRFVELLSVHARSGGA